MAAPLDLRGSNFAPADPRTAVTPALPIPPVPPNDPPVTFLQAARSALAGGRTGETQEALERAETRLLDRAADPRSSAPSTSPALADIRTARHALAVNDRFASARAIGAAIAALSAPPVALATPPAAPLALVPAQSPLAPAVVASMPAGSPPVTKALLPGRWELHGPRYVWVPPDTTLRRVDERAWLQGRYIWRDGAWVWVPAHYGSE